MTNKHRVIISNPASMGGMAYQAALAASDSGRLHSFLTGIYVRDEWIHVLASSWGLDWLRVELGRRNLPGIPSNRVFTFPISKLLPPFLRRLPRGNTLIRRYNLEFKTDNWFDGRAARWISSHGEAAGLLHTYEGAAALQMRAAKSIGLRTLLDVPAVVEDYERAQRRSDTGKYEAAQACRQLADAFLAPSSYVRNALEELGVVGGRKVYVCPLGADPDRFRPAPERDPNRPFRGIFVGTLGYRKGLDIALQAWQHMPESAELWLVGEPDAEGEAIIRDCRGNHRYFGHIPQESVANLMRQCDVFIFPTRAEGFGMVIPEAMASGLPVITTPDVGAEIKDGSEGYEVPPDPEAVATILHRLLSNPDERKHLAQMARQGFLERYTWKRYRQRLVEIYSDAA